MLTRGRYGQYCAPKKREIKEEKEPAEGDTGFLSLRQVYTIEEKMEKGRKKGRKEVVEDTLVKKKILGGRPTVLQEGYKI